MEPLKHECGVAMIRLLKPLEYYQAVSYTHLTLPTTPYV